ncbi:hypothetical protein [Nguyenibacter vanlangensis]|uniref:Uncharacterized protein n=1 Tax=Nguyenibacter vanlangensis TaxID=1216886 RepID=A0A7Y7M677_9PROT|nr:hypothetical protein [Nguyenibacter vanlangensis]NVN10614.1 hypothetical protein [Nguyenibacter vanlangensis]
MERRDRPVTCRGSHVAEARGWPGHRGTVVIAVGPASWPCRAGWPARRRSSGEGETPPIRAWVTYVNVIGWDLGLTFTSVGRLASPPAAVA